MTETKKQEWWWVAVNGETAALSPIASETPPLIQPTPEQLLGYRTLDEAKAAQQFLLTAPVSDIYRSMVGGDLAKRIKAGEISYFLPKKPELPTKGPTQWLYGPGMELDYKADC